MNDALARLSAVLADRYRIKRELGAGGMATVDLAHAWPGDTVVGMLGRVRRSESNRPRS